MWDSIINWICHSVYSFFPPKFNNLKLNEMTMMMMMMKGKPQNGNTNGNIIWAARFVRIFVGFANYLLIVKLVRRIINDGMHAAMLWQLPLYNVRRGWVRLRNFRITATFPALSYKQQAIPSRYEAQAFVAFVCYSEQKFYYCYNFSWPRLAC